MQVDPMQEWQRLTELYREMSDVELEELADDFTSLTESAQQVLRDEIKKRGLDEPQAAVETPRSPARLSAPRPEPAVDLPNDTDADREIDLLRDYTWKTPLCECGDREEALLLCEALRKAGIESWIEGPGSFSPYSSLDQRSPRILVAADQMDAAREIAARPIPREIIDQSRIEAPEFQPPACPGCGAKDPVLEGVEPCNRWRCETCGMQWNESAADLDEKPEKRAV